MVSQYYVQYQYQRGNQLIQEGILLSATSDASALRRITDELQRRFGNLDGLEVSVQQTPAAAPEEELV